MRSATYQYFATVTLNLVAAINGIACGWVSPILPFLSSDETPLDAKLTTEEKSLIAALVCGGGLVGNILFAWISSKFGRRYPLMFIAVPQMVGWILKLYAKNAFHFYIARFVLGLVGGGFYVIAPVFISEFAEDRVRGTLGSSLLLASCFGTLSAFIFGEYCSYDFMPILAIAATLVFLCAFYFIPESPTVLYKMNRMEEAEQSILFYRNLGRKSKVDTETLQTEMNKLQISQANEQKSGDAKLRWSDFTTTTARKAMLIGLVLCGLNQLCGCFAMMNYTATIFKESGSNLSPNVSAIVVGIIQLFGAYVSTILVERAGRKFLLALSLGAASLGLACLGTYIHLKTNGFNVDALGWIPISSFSFIIFFANWGILTLPFLVLSEILPQKIKDAGSAICVGLLSLLAFVMVEYFSVLAEALGLDGSFFLFSAFSLAGTIFVLTMMPETRGKTFEEITILLNR